MQRLCYIGVNCQNKSFFLFQMAIGALECLMIGIHKTFDWMYYNKEYANCCNFPCYISIFIE